tara:strand:+ start:315 stop:416 length:102 start_codon:yes stop_codon:yes gene_type:complete
MRHKKKETFRETAAELAYAIFLILLVLFGLQII